MATAFSDNFFIENLLGLKEEKRATRPSSIRKAQTCPSSTSEGTTDQSVCFIHMCN